MVPPRYLAAPSFGESRRVGLLYSHSPRGDCLCIPVRFPDAYGCWSLEELRSTPPGGHFGRDKALALARRSMWWPGLSAAVDEFIRPCPTCQHATRATCWFTRRGAMRRVTAARQLDQLRGGHRSLRGARHLWGGGGKRGGGVNVAPRDLEFCKNIRSPCDVPPRVVEVWSKGHIAM